MPITNNILDRRAARFVLWSPLSQVAALRLVMWRLRPGNPPAVEGVNVLRSQALQALTDYSRSPPRTAVSLTVSYTTTGSRSKTAGRFCTRRPA
jgi:hypothetical protein